MGLFGTSSRDVRKLEERRNIAGLIKALEYRKDHSIRALAADALGRIGDSQAVDALIPLALDEQESVVSAAAAALGAIRDERGVEPLLRLIQRDSPREPQRAALKALGNIRSAHAVEPLVVRLHSQTWKWERQNVFAALESIGTPAVVPVSSLLRSDDNDLRARASAMLQRLKWRPEDDVQAIYFHIYNKSTNSLIGRGAAILDALCAVLDDPDVAVRRAVTDLLTKIEDERALAALRTRFSDSDKDVVLAAMNALARLDPHGGASLVHLLGHEDWKVREHAVEILGEASGEEIIPLLVGCTKDRTNASKRVAAIRVLGRLRDESTISALLDSYEEEDRKSYTSGLRDAVVEALARFGDGVAATLVGALTDPVRGDVAKGALEKIGKPAIAHLTPLLNAETELPRSTVIDLLGRLGWEPKVDRDGVWLALRREKIDEVARMGASIVPVLLIALREEHETIRISAIRALGAIGSDVAVEALIPLLNDEKGEIRRRASNALGETRNAGAVPALIDSLEDEAVRQSSAYALGELGDMRAASALRKLLGDSDRYVRGAAASALARIGDSDARDDLFALTKDPEFEVRKDAALALAKLGDRRAVGPLKAIYQDKRVSYSQGTVGAALRTLDSAAAQEARSAIEDRCVHHFGWVDRTGLTCGVCSSAIAADMLSEQRGKRCQQCGVAVHVNCQSQLP